MYSDDFIVDPLCDSYSIYEGSPFESVMMYEGSARTAAIPQLSPFMAEENPSVYAPQDGLHADEDSYKFSSPPQQCSLASESLNSLSFSVPPVGNSTFKNSCSTSLSCSRNYSPLTTYSNASISSSATNSNSESENFSSNNFNYNNNRNQINEFNAELPWSDNHYRASNENIAPTYSSHLPGGFSPSLVTIAAPSVPTTTVSFSSSTSIVSSFSQTRTTAASGSPEPSLISFSSDSFSSIPPTTTSTGHLLSKASSFLQTPPSSPPDLIFDSDIASESELASILESLPEFQNCSQNFRDFDEMVKYIATFYERALREDESLDNYRENGILPLAEDMKFVSENPPLSSLLRYDSEGCSLGQTLPEDENEYLPETPGFSDEDRASSPSQTNLATPPPPPLADSLRLQRTLTAVDFEHNYCGNGPSRSHAHILMSPPHADSTPSTTTSAHVKRQLKNAIYDKTIQKRKVGRPPKSANNKVRHYNAVEISTLVRSTHGKPEAYTRRMREEHDEKMKMVACSSGSPSSSSKSMPIRRRRTTASDPNDDLERRVNHNTMERTRRDFIKQSFDTLRCRVPVLTDIIKASKAQILVKSCEHIEDLKVGENALKQEKERLRRRRAFLEKKLLKFEAEEPLNYPY